LANAIPLFLIVYLRVKDPPVITPIGLAFVVMFGLAYAAALGLIQMGIVHLVAKQSTSVPETAGSFRSYDRCC
jgi:hypothetical protein